MNFSGFQAGLKPLARIVGYGDAALEPVDWPVIYIIASQPLSIHIKQTLQVSKLGLKPLARIVGYGDAAVEPVDWPVAPALGVKQMLDRWQEQCFLNLLLLTENTTQTISP